MTKTYPDFVSQLYFCDKLGFKKYEKDLEAFTITTNRNGSHVKDFALIDDRQTSTKNKATKVTYIDGTVQTFTGNDRYDKAKEAAKAYFETWTEANTPKGLHYLEKNNSYDETMYGLYDDCALIAEIKPEFRKSDEAPLMYKIRLNEYRFDRFFEDQLNSHEVAILKGKIQITEAEINLAKSILARSYDQGRYNQVIEIQRAEKLEEEKVNSQFLGLPELKGTQKQIDWAVSIRMKFVDAIGTQRIMNGKWTKEAKTAKFWIELRNAPAQSIVDLAFK